MSTQGPTAEEWRKRFAAYQQPQIHRALIEIVLTIVPLVLIWTAAWFAVHYGYWWLALLLNIPAAGFVVRLFMVQHDCGHRAFFGSPKLNDWVGRAIGVVTMTPYDCWRREHAIHHATSGNLDRRNVGSIVMVTVDEYRAMSGWGRFAYRLYRHPFMLFAFGPAFVFLLQQRLPVGLMKEGWRPWVSAMGTNLVLAAVIVAVVLMGGWKALLLVHLPTTVLAASIGVWLFYVQHQFEGTYWARKEEWTQTEAAFHGSSHYDLPAPLRWLTGNIGVHHVHHVSARVPFYRLHKVLKDHPELRSIGRLTLPESVRMVGLTLWDEARQRLITFREYRAGLAAA